MAIHLTEAGAYPQLPTTKTNLEKLGTLMCQINLHAGLFGTFCFSKGKRSFCLSLLKLQNVPNKPACRLIWHIRVPTYHQNLNFLNRSEQGFGSRFLPTLTCLINMHACLLGTFCNFKRERQNDLFPFEKQNVPNKHACMFIRQVRV